MHFLDLPTLGDAHDVAEVILFSFCFFFIALPSSGRQDIKGPFNALLTSLRCRWQVQSKAWHLTTLRFVFCIIPWKQCMHTFTIHLISA